MGANEWRPLVHSDTIEPGDTVITGSDGLLLIKFSSAGKILLGEETNVTYSDTASSLLSGQIVPVGFQTVAGGVLLARFGQNSKA